MNKKSVKNNFGIERFMEVQEENMDVKEIIAQHILVIQHTRGC